MLEKKYTRHHTEPIIHGRTYMSTLDHENYRKVIQIVAESLDSSEDLTIDAAHDKVDIFDVSFTTVQGEQKQFRILRKKYELDVIIKKEYFPEKKFDKWLSNFEYELEQTFLTNIKVDVDENPVNYDITVHF
jgi:hypothetical protein